MSATGTPAAQVYDLLMQQITDYRLDTLFNTSVTDFENYLSAWLLLSCNDFDVCNQDLTFDTSVNCFVETLNQTNITILSQLMVKYWMQKNVNDVLSMNLKVIDKDFRTASEAPNLQAKTAQLNKQEERCSQALINYAYRKNTDWNGWFNQSFAG